MQCIVKNRIVITLCCQ